MLWLLAQLACRKRLRLEWEMRPLVLLVDSQVSASSCCLLGLDTIGCERIETTNLAEVGQWIDSPRPRIILLPFCGHEAALQTALQIRQMDKGLPVILVVAEGSEGLAVAAFRAGITDYFHAPGEQRPLQEKLRCWIAARSAPCQCADSSKAQAKGSASPLTGSTATMLALREQLVRIAQSSSNVLITGETGTGKELVASAIHQESARSTKPMVRVNCAAIPDALAESELFGYERGAFTGAYLRTERWFEAADLGIMFLDEVGDMSSVTQAKLLRVIENKEFRRLGGKAEIRVDVRFIAATNRDLERMASEGRFREDLYYRLNIARIHLLPLRDRKEDIPILIRHYVQEFSANSEKRVTEIADEVWNCLLKYESPGNIRELQNVLESSCANSPCEIISIGDLPDQFRRRCANPASTCPTERQALLSALLQSKWNKSRAAEQLSWSRMTLYRKMRKYRISDCVDPRIQ